MLKQRSLTIAALLLLCVTSAQAQPENGARIFVDLIAPVLTHPRCLNCHTKTEFPRQGDERRRHDFAVARGSADTGAPGLPCSTCHGTANLPASFGKSVPPGAPNWHLAPLAMAWEGLSAGQLCRRLKDLSRNHNRNVDALVVHMSTDPLVGWGWNPGSGRNAIPISREAFATKLKQWQQQGAGCPT